jgi:hypothetical protein
VFGGLYQRGEQPVPFLNIIMEPMAGGYGACRHCGAVLADDHTDAGLALAVYEGPPTDAGPQITATASDYIDAPVVFRQYCCRAPRPAPTRVPPAHGCSHPRQRHASAR